MLNRLLIFVGVKAFKVGSPRRVFDDSHHVPIVCADITNEELLGWSQKDNAPSIIFNLSFGDLCITLIGSLTAYWFSIIRSLVIVSSGNSEFQQVDHRYGTVWTGRPKVCKLLFCRFRARHQILAEVCVWLSYNVPLRSENRMRDRSHNWLLSPQSGCLYYSQKQPATGQK
jgi:hypothetical protein